MGRTSGARLVTVIPKQK